MGHKLSDRWRCHLIPKPGGVKPEGHMDLTDMDDAGVLRNGRYYLPGSTGDFRKLTGHATGLNPLVLTLSEFNERNVLIATYTGTLIYEHVDGNRMVLVGKKHFEASGVELAAEIAEQNDPPWILTKP